MRTIGITLKITLSAFASSISTVSKTMTYDLTTFPPKPRNALLLGSVLKFSRITVDAVIVQSELPLSMKASTLLFPILTFLINFPLCQDDSRKLTSFSILFEFSHSFAM